MRRRTGFVAALAAASLLFGMLPAALTGCSRGTAYAEDTFVSMDTVISVKLDPATPDIGAVFRRCREITEEQRLIYDADDPGSETGRYDLLPPSDRAGRTACSEDLCTAVRLAQAVASQTGKAFAPGLREAVLLWKQAELSQTLPDAGRLAAAVAGAADFTAGPDGAGGWEIAGSGSGLDLGGIGKGAAEQKVVDYLMTTGARYGVVSFGGNIAVFGEKPGAEPFGIAVRDPEDPSGTVGLISLDRGFVSVSGNYERYYEIGGTRYGHVLDPLTGMPAGGELLSVAVVCDDGALADALSTALFVMGAEKAAELAASGTGELMAGIAGAYGDGGAFVRDGRPVAFECVFVTSGGTFVTPGLEGRFVPSSGG